MEMFLQDMVRLCAAIALLGGMFLGWLVTKCREGIAWKAPLWHDGEKWRTIEPSLEGDYTMADNKDVKDSDLHPVRFTRKQFGLIDHIMGDFSEYFEEEAEDFFETMDKYRDK